jgi:formate hydrogenlyase transcriptional activator
MRIKAEPADTPLTGLEMEGNALIRRYQALLGVSEAIAAHRDLKDLLHHLAPSLRPLVPFDFLNLVLHDPAEDAMYVHVLETQVPSSIPRGKRVAAHETPAGWAFERQQPLVVSNIEGETRWSAILPLLRENGVKSLCVVPLTTARRRLGGLSFASRQAAAYDNADLEFLGQVARQVAVAVDNALNAESAQAYERDLARERDRLKILLDINNAVVSRLDLKDLFEVVSGSVRGKLGHAYSSLLLYDAERDLLSIEGLDFSGDKKLLPPEFSAGPGTSPAGLAIATRKPVLMRFENFKDYSKQIMDVLADAGMRSGLCVPLIAGARVLGTLNVGDASNAAFPEEEIEFLSQVAGQITLAVENALAYGRISQLKDKLAEEKQYLEGEIRTQYNLKEVVGEGAAWTAVIDEVRVVAPTNTAVLIQGETGTGKELVARAVHELGRRKERTFVKLNCAAIPTGLLESELFGHEKGAFTGAIARKVGRFELAHQGTLFLDEIGDIPLELQPKLLRVLQEQEFERLGGTKTIRVDVRLVAATNRDLEKMVASGEFRSDLYYRLKVFPITLPPLRERVEDLPLLIHHFVAKYARRLRRRIDSVPAPAMAALERYSWPGNVRELENFIERAVILSPGPELRVALDQLKSAADLTGQSAGALTLEEVERQAILRALNESRWVVGGPSGAARRLGMKRTTLQARMQKLGIQRPA